MRNKEKFIKLLNEKTTMSIDHCNVVNNILESHFIIGKNNKEKIVNDFMEKLNLGYEDADELYNNCAEILVKNIFKKN